MPNEAIRLRYDSYEDDAYLACEIVRADEDGVPCEPILVLCDEQTGERISLSLRNARQLRALLDRL